MGSTALGGVGVKHTKNPRNDEWQAPNTTQQRQDRNQGTESRNVESVARVLHGKHELVSKHFSIGIHWQVNLRQRAHNQRIGKENKDGDKTP